MGCSGQSSPSSIGISMTSSGLPRPWKNQLWFSNWIHAAASALSVSAGLKGARFIRSSEIFRGFGSYSRAPRSGLIRFGLMLRLNARPAEPMSGSFRSFQRPSGRRAVSASLGGSSVASSLIWSRVSNRFLSRRSRRSASRLSALSEVIGSSYHWRLRLILVNVRDSTRTGSDLSLIAISPTRPRSAARRRPRRRALDRLPSRAQSMHPTRYPVAAGAARGQPEWLNAAGSDGETLHRRWTLGLWSAAGLALTAALCATAAPVTLAGEPEGSGDPDAGAQRTGPTPAVARAAAAETGPGCDARLPVVVHHPGGAAASLPARARLPIACADPTGFATSESTIAAGNDVSLFYSPAHTENTLGRSFDQGATWDLTYPPKMQYTSLWNTVDPIVTVDRRTGRLFWLRATGDTRTTPVLVDESPFGNQAATAIAYAHGFQVYSSPDDGQTWATADYQHEFTGDWEKLFVGPPRPASTGAPQPSGYPDVVYMCGNAPLEVSGPGRACYRSLDGGASFALASYVFPSPSAPADACPTLAGNSGVVDSRGVTYQPQSCANATYLAVSEDEGSSYVWRPIQGAPPINGLSGTVQVAVDSADNLYALWVTNDKLELAISRDHGKTWGDPLDVTPPGLKKIALTALSADEPGHVGMTYYAT